MVNVLFTWPLLQEEEELLRRFIKVPINLVYPKSLKNRWVELKEVIPTVEIIVGGYIPDWVIEKAEKLKFIQCLSAGVERLNLKLLKERGILLSSASGVNAIAVAEHAFALMLALAKKITTHDCSMKKGEWIGYTYETMVLELWDKNLGIIGLGKIGIEIAKRARAFGMDVYAIKRRPSKELQRKLGLKFLGGPKDLDLVLSVSDFVVLSVPLTPETINLIGERELRLMKPTAFLINVSRGPVVDESALYRALTEGWIAGAGIDVWWAYPPDPDAPSKLKIHQLPNVVATPHKAGWTKESRKRALKLAAININRYVKGLKPHNLVDYEKGY